MTWREPKVLSPPDVGFWVPASLGSSLIWIEHTARMGVPFERNSVYFALTFSRYPVYEKLPNPRRTALGSGLFLSLESCVGIQASGSDFTVSETWPPGSSEASRNISTVSEAG